MTRLVARLAVLNLALAVVYAATAWASVHLPIAFEGSALLWIPSGLALAATLVYGRTMVLGIALGAAAFAWIERQPAALIAVAAISQPVEAWFAAVMLEWSGFRRSLKRAEDVANLALFGALLASSVGATLFAWAQLKTGLAPDSDFRDAWLHTWLGHALGTLVVTPLALTGREFLSVRWSAARVIEGFALLAALFAVAEVVFGGWITAQPTLAFVVFPLLVWGALRFGQTGASLIAFLVACIACGGMATGSGPFQIHTGHEGLALLYAFVTVASLTTSILAALIAQRTEFEEQLRETDARLHAAFDNIPFDFWVVDREQRYVMQNLSSIRNWGPVLGRRPADVSASPETIARWSSENARALAGETVLGEVSYSVGGSTRHFYQVIAPVRDGDKVRGALGINIDITDRRRAEEALRQGEERYRLLLENSSDWVTRHAADGHYTYVSPVSRKVVGYEPEELLGRDPYELFHPDDLERIRHNHAAVMRSAESYSINYRFRRKDGAFVWLETRAKANFAADGRTVNEIVCSTSDISERIRLEEELRQTQRLDAIGRLGGGVAHDFNNLLTVINGYADLLLALLEPGEERSLVEEVRKAGDRAAGLTRQLLAFSRKQYLRPIALDLNQLVRDTERMLRRVIREDIQLHSDLEADLLPLYADPGQLVQVLLNLASNAQDAMGRGGNLTVETRNVVLPERRPTESAERPTGACIRVRVIDDGAGMDEETRARAFEPFFTTKELGKGTGLGLATVYGIVKQSGGLIDIESKVGVGTTITIVLPATPNATVDASEEPTAPEVPHGTETVLLVEDEQGVRSFVARVLSRSGYRVLEAQNAADALALGADAWSALDGLVTDVVMPGMSGPELAARLRERRPGLPVLFISGYADEFASQIDRTDEQQRWLAKPFTASELAAELRAVLDAPR